LPYGRTYPLSQEVKSKGYTVTDVINYNKATGEMALRMLLTTSNCKEANETFHNNLLHSYPTEFYQYHVNNDVVRIDENDIVSSKEQSIYCY
jgi:hypothetical protein